MRRFALVAAAAALAAASSPLPATNLQAEYMNDNPLINTPTPRFSWVPQHPDRGSVQTGYRIVVNSTTAGGATVWDSGKVASTQTAQVEYAGSPIESDSVYTWSVSWFDQAGAQSDWSAPATFGTGWLDPTAWDSAGSQWIGCAAEGTNVTDGMNQVRVEFSVPQPKTQGATPTQARLYVTGIGWHIAGLNGRRLGDSPLDPAFTTLPKRVLYTVHDVLGLLDTSATGVNAFSIMLGHGWPDVIVPWAPSGSGDPSWNGSAASSSGSDAASLAEWRESLMDMTEEDVKRLSHGHTGYERRLRMVLSVRWSDGSTSAVVSSAPTMGASAASVSSSAGPVAAGTWMCGAGALLSDDLYGGCSYDARLETTGWDLPGYAYPAGTTWAPAVRKADPGGVMYGEDFPLVEVVDLLEPRSVWESTPGTYIFDLAQNMAGVVRLRLPAPTRPGVTITLRHAEAVLHPPYGPQNGSLYFGNLRSAEATDVYVTKGVSEGFEEFVPLFTWHGFRYVQVDGLDFVPTVTGVVTGLVFRSGFAAAGNIAFPAQANVLNQLQHAIFWGQQSNLAAGNPSDCPQRDERLGWTGDSALSSEEATLNFDMAGYLSHWADSLADSATNSIDPGFVQYGLPAVVPNVITGYNADSAWMSVYPSNVYAVYKTAGDTRVIQRHWSNLLGFVNLTTSAFKGNIAKIFHTWGDWCPPPDALGGGQGPKPDPAFTAGVAFLDDLRHIIEMAGAIGDNANQAQLTSLWQQLAAEFNSAWFHGTYYGSSPTDGAQTAQACALGLGVVSPANVSTVVNYLVNDIQANHAGHLSVGIIGQKYLTRALTANGQSWLAANISLQTDYPSFGWAFNHPVEPATTLWELWDGPSEGPGMNSRNHIMQGAIGVWLYADVAGIEQAPGTAGWTSAVLAPKVTNHESLPGAAGWHETIRGRFELVWANMTSTTGGQDTSFTLQATVPVNVAAVVRIPIAAGADVSAVAATEGGTSFFAAGAYKPGVAGITGAAIDATTNTLNVNVGSGTYNFVLTA